MDPITMMMAAATLVKAGGAIFGGLQGSKLAHLQSQLLSSNAQLYSTQADVALLDKNLAYTAGAFNAGKVAKAVTRTLGAESAGFASRNLDPSSGSPLLVQMYSAGQGAVDRELVGAQALLEGASAEARAASIRQQGASQYFQAYGAEQKGYGDLMSGIFGAGTALLQGGSQLAGGFNLSSSAGAGGGIGKVSFDIGDPFGAGK